MMGLGLGLLTVPGHTHLRQIDQCRGVNFDRERFLCLTQHLICMVYGVWRICPILSQSMVKRVWCKLW